MSPHINTLGLNRKEPIISLEVESIYILEDSRSMVWYILDVFIRYTLVGEREALSKSNKWRHPPLQGYFSEIGGPGKD